MVAKIDTTIKNRLCKSLGIHNKAEVSGSFTKKQEVELKTIYVIDKYWKTWSDSDIEKLECWLNGN